MGPTCSRSSTTTGRWVVECDPKITTHRAAPEVGDRLGKGSVDTVPFADASHGRCVGGPVTKDGSERVTRQDVDQRDEQQRCDSGGGDGIGGSPNQPSGHVIGRAAARRLAGPATARATSTP